MFDDIKHTLADRVSYLLKTRYAHLAYTERPFDLAFTDTMNEFGIRGEGRIGLKSSIGKILSSRPKKLRGNKTLLVKKKTHTPLAVMNARRNEVLISALPGITMCFRRDSKGHAVNVSYTGNPPSGLLREAQGVAEGIFTEKDREAVAYTRLRILEEDANHLLVMLADTYEAYISRGLRTDVVAMTITQNGKSVSQKVVPADLLREAKAIAVQCFKHSGSLPLPFEFE